MTAGEMIETLKARHAELESALVAEENRPHPDDVSIAVIKKKKLQLKDELQRLEDA